MDVMFSVGCLPSYFPCVILKPKKKKNWREAGGSLGLTTDDTCDLFDRGSCVCIENGVV